MIQTRFKIYGIFAIAMTTILFVGICFFIYALVSVVFFDGNIFKKGSLPASSTLAFITVLIILLAVIINSWTRYVFKIKIITTKKTIWFKNIFTRHSQLYNFDDFDGYIDTYEKMGKSGSYKVIYLIKNNKAEKIITSFYYSNFDEIEEALSAIKYLGFQKNSSAIILKALFNRQILAD